MTSRLSPPTPRMKWCCGCDSPDPVSPSSRCARAWSMMSAPHAPLSSSSSTLRTVPAESEKVTETCGSDAICGAHPAGGRRGRGRVERKRERSSWGGHVCTFACTYVHHGASMVVHATGPPVLGRRVVVAAPRGGGGVLVEAGMCSKKEVRHLARPGTAQHGLARQCPSSRCSAHHDDRVPRPVFSVRVRLWVVQLHQRLLLLLQPGPEPKPAWGTPHGPPAAAAAVSCCCCCRCCS